MGNVEQTYQYFFVCVRKLIYWYDLALLGVINFPQMNG